MRSGPFARMRQARADERELGTGLWRRDHDRFARAMDRCWQVLQEAEARSQLAAEEINGVVHACNVLAEALPEVRALCVRLQAQFPAGEDHRIPPAASETHRELSRASHELAATAQAIAMFRLRQAGTDAVGRHAERTLAHVRRAHEVAPVRTG